MSQEQQWVVVGCLVALCLLVAVLALHRARVVSRELRAQSIRADELAERLASWEADRLRDAPVTSARAGATPAAPEQTFVITQLGDVAPTGEPAAEAPGRIDGRLFADLVARETLVKSAGLVHGVRRALAPETRNRIRFEMRREVKRSKRNRRSEMKVAWREYQARQRGQVTFDEGDAA
ncbi:MAG: hypothetical protein ACI379_02960 [Nocardioides sp.]|uniref:hypothetical protein n=1 Tax=Nocardioides sp. TaxID=35761 RepID=UPI003F004AC2